MATNKNFNFFNNVDEQTLFNEIVVESIEIFGVDVIYMPRKILKMNKVLGEPAKSSFDKSITIEAYLPQLGMGSGGEGDLMKAWGLSTDSSTEIQISQTRFAEEIKKHGLSPVKYNHPLEGDLIYIGAGYNSMTNELFQIMECGPPEVDWQHGKRFVYSLKLELFVPSYEKIKTGNKHVDNINFTITNEKELNKASNKDIDEAAEIIINTDEPNPFRGW